jgi:energy-coupling factor transport system ATP-binding protein
MRPAYLIADEPTALLDPVGRSDVLEALRRLRGQGVGVLHVTHHLEDVLDADRVLVLSAGAVAFDGTPDGLVSDPARAIDLGIELPAEVLLADALRHGGVPVPSGYPSAEKIVEALCRS